MNDPTAEASINVIQALNRAITYYRPANLHKPAFNMPSWAKSKEQPKVSDDTQELAKATEGAHDILYKANTVFPFNLFPDTVVLDREKLTIANRVFFGVARITSVAIQDILSVEADVGPFFGSLHLTSRFFFTNPRHITYLWRNDAIKFQRLLQGYIIAREQNIDCSKIEKKELIKLLEDLGKGDTG